MDRYALHRAYEREEDMLGEQFNGGDLTEAEYRQSLRELQWEAKDAEEQAREEHLRRGGW